MHQVTGLADDLHMQWVLEEPRHFRNACAQVGFILTDLADMGMQVSTDKTVILLALAGPSYDKVTSPTSFDNARIGILRSSQKMALSSCR